MKRAIGALDARLERERSRARLRAGETDRRKHRSKIAVGHAVLPALRAVADIDADGDDLAALARGAAADLAAIVRRLGPEAAAERWRAQGQDGRGDAADP